MNHSWFFQWNLHSVDELSIFSKQRIVNARITTLWAVSKSQQLTISSVNSRMGRNLMFELAFEIVVSDTFDVKLFLATIDFDVEWQISLMHGVSSLFVVNKRCVGQIFFEILQIRLVSNFLLKTE